MSSFSQFCCHELESLHLMNALQNCIYNYIIIYCIYCISQLHIAFTQCMCKYTYIIHIHICSQIWNFNSYCIVIWLQNTHMDTHTALHKAVHMSSCMNAHMSFVCQSGALTMCVLCVYVCACVLADCVCWCAGGWGGIDGWFRGGDRGEGRHATVPLQPRSPLCHPPPVPPPPPSPSPYGPRLQ